MNIDWLHFTPWQALAGGLLIGLASALYLLGNGRIAGIIGIVGEPLRAFLGPKAAGASSQSARLFFIAGLLLAPWLWLGFAPWPQAQVDVGPLGLVLAGVLVGFGARLGNGCTSGHGVCGLSRLSLRSLVNVLVFMAAGFATVFVMRHLLTQGG